MNFKALFRCTFSLALIAFAGCGGGSNPVARLKKNMVQIPGKDYLVCKYEVTQALWEYVMGENPSESWGMGPDHPVDNVSWDDCQVFLKKLNALPEVKASGNAYRIPTADEWKFACLAGATGDHSSFYPSLYCKLANGEEITRKTLAKVAWYHDNSAIKGMMHKHPVGKKSPNAFGLYDMHGNVKEWTSTTDSRGYQLIFGGDFYSNAADCMADNGHSLDPYYHPYNTSFSGVGLRLVTDKSGKATCESAKQIGKRPEYGNADSGKAGANSGEEYMAEATKYLTDDASDEDIAKGVALLRKAAELGNANAQMNLGLCYYMGTFLEKDATKAVEWLNKAAEQDMPLAQFVLGGCYFAGIGVEKDEDKAVEYITKAAEQGLPQAQYTLGDWNYVGSNGFKKDSSKAAEWYKKAAEQGFPQAQFNLGMCYEEGWGVDQDEAKAVELYKKAAEQGFEEAKQKLAEMGYNSPKNSAEQPKGLVAKLTADMVPIPGKNFTMCKYEVTQTLWEAVMGENPSEFTGASSPVEKVSWNDCQKFLEKLNALPEVKASGITYRLPTAEEWCYACLAGGEDGYCKLADGTEITKDTIGEVANCIHNLWRGGTPSPVTPDSTNPVGRKKPNAFGLYDVHGNVSEWTSTAYQGGRLALGGSWNHLAYGCMVIPMISALGSDKKAPDYKDNTIGLRLVADKSEEAEEGSAGEAEMRKEPENTNSIKTDANAGKTYLKEGLKYRDGDGVEKDVAKAMSLLRKAAELGEANAYFYLGSFYYEGNGVEKNMAMVADLWRKGAEIEKAQNRQTIIRWMLSTCLLQQGGAENETEAVKWLEQASELVNVDNIDDVRFLLAVCYLQGKGLPPGASRRQYEAKGRQLLAIAALRGHKDAAKALESLDEP